MTSSGFCTWLAIALLTAVVAHWRIRRFARATLLAAVASSLAFQLVHAAWLGALDPFAPIAFVVTLLPAAVVALLVGVPFFSRRAADS